MDVPSVYLFRYTAIEIGGAGLGSDAVSNGQLPGSGLYFRIGRLAVSSCIATSRGGGLYPMSDQATAPKPASSPQAQAPASARPAAFEGC